ncbi:hypothetical protein [Virgibacillus profundi]|nr:hypothetical protein [Virgibacillus profundi]
MKGKIVVFIVILATLAVLALCWVFLQNIIEEYDLDRATTEMIEMNIY